MHTRRSDFGLILGLAAAYVVAARFGLAFDALAGFATLVWPPTGIALVSILVLWHLNYALGGHDQTFGLALGTLAVIHSYVQGRLASRRTTVTETDISVDVAE